MKKTLAILLMLTLMISALAACGKGKKENGEASQKGERYFHVAQKLLDDGTLYSFQYIEYVPKNSDCDKKKTNLIVCLNSLFCQTGVPVAQLE